MSDEAGGPPLNPEEQRRRQLKALLTEQDLEDIERRGWEALSGPAGAAFYDEIMADDGVMVFPGRVMDRATALEAIRTSGPWITFELTDVRVVGDQDVGLVTYNAKAQRADGPPYESTMSSVYVRRAEGWRLLLHQQSPRG